MSVEFEKMRKKSVKENEEVVDGTEEQTVDATAHGRNPDKKEGGRVNRWLPNIRIRTLASRVSDNL